METFYVFNYLLWVKFIVFTQTFKMKSKLLFSITFLLISIPFVFLSSCKEDEEPAPQPTTGKVAGVVSDGLTANPQSDVRVVLFNANSNEPTGQVDLTDANGAYGFTIKGGNYYVKVTKQNYDDVPAKGLAGLAFTVSNGSTTTHDVEMFESNSTNIGLISGQLSSSDIDVDGALVVASNGVTGFSTISDSIGNYVIYNVPADNYTVQAWRVGLESTVENVLVTSNTASENVNLSVKGTSGSTVSGSVTFLATSNSDVDVSLTHPESEESIPGLTTITSGGNYSISGVSNGTYLARASYANDGIVIDPDWIVKNGEPFVTVSGGATRNFSVTGAVTIDSPTNPASSTVPVATSVTPTFTWTKYSSTSDYVIKVTDANGNLVWGGFNADWTVKNIVIPSSQSSIAFNSDGNALKTLQVGKVYRWKIYASKDNTQSPAGWELISVSEDQRGLIIIE